MNLSLADSKVSRPSSAKHCTGHLFPPENRGSFVPSGGAVSGKQTLIRVR
jgi:hypothetical protein